jgi:TolA-binding protein
MKAFFRSSGSRMMRTVLAVVASVLLIFSAASPAVAFGNSSSSPAKGTAQMNDLQAESERAVKREPRDLKEVQRKAQEGPNEVQGRADMNKMNTPENSKQATTVREQVENAFEDVMSGR